MGHRPDVPCQAIRGNLRTLGAVSGVLIAGQGADDCRGDLADAGQRVDEVDGEVGVAFEDGEEEVARGENAGGSADWAGGRCQPYLVRTAAATPVFAFRTPNSR